jgi:hypothetical protein
MARKKDLVPHFVRGFILENPFEFGKSGDWLNYIPKGQFVETANNQIVPPLESGWQNTVETIVGKAPSPADFGCIELVAKQYVAERVARQVNPIEWRETIARIERICRASKLLLNELNDWGDGYNLIWRRVEQISKIGGLSALTHNDVYPIISRLYSALSAAVIQAQSEHQQGAVLSHQEPWELLVTQLADFWTKAGGSATAPKSGRGGYAPASPFVQLVWTVMTCAVPKHLREFTASPGAMQAAISKALSVARQKASGPFSKKRVLNKSRHRRR